MAERSEATRPDRLGEVHNPPGPTSPNATPARAVYSRRGQFPWALNPRRRRRGWTRHNRRRRARELEPRPATADLPTRRDWRSFRASVGDLRGCAPGPDVRRTIVTAAYSLTRRPHTRVPARSTAPAHLRSVPRSSERESTRCDRAGECSRLRATARTCPGGYTHRLVARAHLVLDFEQISRRVTEERAFDCQLRHSNLRGETRH